MAHPLPLILLPPSEGKAPGGARPGVVAGHDVGRPRRPADARPWRGCGRRCARTRPPRQAARGQGCGARRGDGGEPIGRDARRRCRRSIGTPGCCTARSTRRRWTVRRGGAWTMPCSSCRACGASSRRVDPIPDYKLKMGALAPGPRQAVDLVASGGRRGDRRRLQRAAAEGPCGTCCPRSTTPPGRGWRTARCTRVRFLEPGSGGELVAVSHWNKFLKGALVRFLVEHPGAGPDELAAVGAPVGLRAGSRADRRAATGRVQLVKLRPAILSALGRSAITAGRSLGSVGGAATMPSPDGSEGAERCDRGRSGSVGSWEFRSRWTSACS